MKIKRIALSLVVFVLILSTNSISFAEFGVRTKTTNCTANLDLPDTGCTPGAILTTDAKVVCVPGYTKKVRSVSTSLKKKVFASYGISYGWRDIYEVDHLISLELGGSNDISNLWPQLKTEETGAIDKNKFENSLHKQVCKGKITLKEAQEKISTNWLESSTSTQKKVVTPTAPSITNVVAPKPEIKPVVIPSPAITPQAPIFVPVIPTPVNPEPVYVPAPTSTPAAPIDPAQGATAKCGDGTYSHSTSRSGTCSHHGGVAQWL